MDVKIGSIGFIGGGNMAKAIAHGILKKGLVSPSQIIVSATSECTLSEWKNMGVKTTCLNDDVIKAADIIFLACKPYQLDSVLKCLNPELSLIPSKLFVSVLAGTKSQVLYNKISACVNKNVRIIRVMPNTPAKVCEGCSAIAVHSSATEDDVKIVKEIFLSIGKCEIVPEYIFSAVTGLAGSGPAYVYAIIEALSDGGVKHGLPRELATTFAAQTVLGAAQMVLTTKKHPGELKDEVCSAGGTTIYGIHALEKGGLRTALMNAVEAAVQRCQELSGD